MFSYQDLLRRRSFTPYWLGGALSFASPSTVLVVMIWATATAYPASDPSADSFSALALAILGLSATVPTLAAAVLSGTLADRFERRRLMAVTNIAAVLATAGLVATLFAHPDGTIHLPGPPDSTSPSGWGSLAPFGRS